MKKQEKAYEIKYQSEVRSTGEYKQRRNARRKVLYTKWRESQGRQVRLYIMDGQHPMRYKRSWISSKKAYTYDHVTKYEEYNKCCLLSWGVVHHKNYDTLDNSESNLQGMMERDHGQLTIKEKYIRCIGRTMIVII